MATTTEAIQTDDQFDRVWTAPSGLRGLFSSVNHKSVGRRYMVTAFVLFLIGGVQSLFMRAQLARPENTFLGPETYNELFTMHGTTMMFLFAIPFIEGLATYLLPLQLGCRDMPFPRYNSFNFWCYVFGGLILYSSFLFAMVPDAGWFAYVPLSGPDFSDTAMDFWLFGLTLAELAAVGAAIEIIVTVLRMRAPGMALHRIPIFAWTMLSVAFLIIVAFVPLIVASLLLELDRTIGTAFFDTTAGGNPLLWQHLFWIFGHPEVYVMFLPGAAIISHVIPVHSQRRLAAYPLVVVAVVSTAVLSLGLWVHHMYTTGLPSVTLGFFTAASMSITLASGIQIFAWLATLWAGRPRFTVPMMYALGFIVTFVAGGITGVMVASVALDAQVHDTYFVVAHFHYVVLGGMLFPVFAAFFHWWPKVTGRMTVPWLGHLSFWLVFLGFHITFFPMHLSGLWGMPRRVYTYERELGVDTTNLISTIGAFVLALGVLVFVLTFVLSYVRGNAAPDDPWGGDTLEWSASTPPPTENWPRIPVVTSRYPRWDPDPGPDVYPETQAVFDRAPSSFRATPMTTVISAKPDGVAHLASPTYWPVVPALGLALVAVTVLGQWYAWGLLGVAIFLVGLAGWAWRNESERGERTAAPLLESLPFETTNSSSVGWWGAGGAGAVFLVAMVTLNVSALYLQVNAAVWPPGGTLNRPWVFLGTLVLSVVACGVAWWGSRQGREGDWNTSDSGVRTAHLSAIAIAIVAGAVALALVAYAWFGSGLQPTAHAYYSVVWTLLGGQSLIVAAAIGVTALALLGRLRHDRDSRPGMLLKHAAILWGTATLTWLLVWATTDLLPAILI